MLVSALRALRFYGLDKTIDLTNAYMIDLEGRHPDQLGDLLQDRKSEARKVSEKISHMALDRVQHGLHPVRGRNVVPYPDRKIVSFERNCPVGDFKLTHYPVPGWFDSAALSIY